MAHIIVVGNEKGGSGKSTVAMHLAIALVRMGHSVGALDLDLRQHTLSRFLENRENHKISLPCPEFHELSKIDHAPIKLGENIYDNRLSAAVASLEADSDFILIDCPGSHTRLSQVAHSLADTLITPLNDSFVDFDLLAQVDPDSNEILGTSVYSEMVWNARQLRAQAGLAPIDWVVMRNRLGAQPSHNKIKMRNALEALAKRIGFRLIPALGDRIIFRELFLRGLTLLDLKDIGVKGQMNVSNIAARKELGAFVKSLNLPGVSVDF